MKMTKHISTFSRQAFLLLFLIHQTVFAAEHSDNISEEYLRSQFTFGANEILKFSECKKKSYPTCTYVWGTDSKKDAYRVKAGLAPEGNKLQIIYAQASSAKDFQRVLATYSDAEKIEGVGLEAIWSNSRKQLSFITDMYLVVHVNINVKGEDNPKEKAISIAKDLLEKL